MRDKFAMTCAILLGASLIIALLPIAEGIYGLLTEGLSMHPAPSFVIVTWWFCVAAFGVFHIATGLDEMIRGKK